MKFARQINGAWFDPVQATTLAELEHRYHPEWVAAQRAAGAWFQAIGDDVWAFLLPPAPPPPPPPPPPPTIQDLHDQITALSDALAAAIPGVSQALKQDS